MQGHPVSEQRLKEVLGHNPLEVMPPISFHLPGSYRQRTGTPIGLRLGLNCKQDEMLQGL